MADRIKGITIEIDGDTTKLSKALKDVNSELKQSQNNLKDIDKLLKMDPGNTTLLQQKFKNMGTEIEATKKKLDTLREAEKQATTALANGDMTQQEFDALQREIVETEQKLQSLTKEFQNFGSVSAQQVAAAGEKLKGVGTNVENAGKAIMPASTAMMALGAAAVKTTSDFDSAMSTVSAVSGATGKDLEDLRDKAKEMGEKTVFSASEAADAMNYMAMAGWKTGDMLDGIEGIMNLAAASGEDLATTSDIVTDALTAFGLTAADSGHFADILAAASSNANTNVSMMGETFKYCAPIAGAMGYSAEDTAVAIGLMANSGIKASQAGTSLRKIMTELSGEIEISGEKLGDVTIQTTNTDGTMRSLSDILGDCRDAFSQLTESEKASTAEALVGKTGMAGFLAIMNAGEGDVNKLTEAINGCNGAAKEMADTKVDNLEGPIKLLKSQLESLAISIGEILIPIVRDIVSHISTFVGWLNSLSDGQKKVVVAVMAVIAAAGPLLIFIGKLLQSIGTIMTWAPKLVSAFNGVKTAVSVLGGGLKALWAVIMANPIVLIVAAIAAAVAAFIYFWNTSEGFRQFWINLWDGLKDAVSSFIDGAKALWESFVDALSQIWETIKNVVSVALQFIAELIKAYFEIMMIPWRFIWENFGSYLTQAWETLKGIVSGALDAIANAISTAWEAIKTFFGTIFEAIKGVFVTYWTAISSVMSTVMSAIQSVVATVWNAIKGVITTVMNAIQSVVATVWNAIRGVVTTVMNAIKSVVTTVWNAVKSTVSGTINSIKSVISSGLNAAKNTVSNVLGAIKDKFSSIWDGVKSIVSGAIEKIKGLMNFHWELPHLKLPHFSIEGSFSLNPPSVPHFGIEWYKKAMADGMILNSPTIFGAAGGRLLAGGEAGPEAVVGTDSLRGMIGEAVTAAVAGLGGDITIPVYIGNRKLDTLVVDAMQRSNYRSGGR